LVLPDHQQDVYESLKQGKSVNITYIPVDIAVSIYVIFKFVLFEVFKVSLIYGPTVISVSLSPAVAWFLGSQARQCIYKRNIWRDRVTIVVVERQWGLHIPSGCL
jgi:hypothetical protein